MLKKFLILITIFSNNIIFAYDFSQEIKSYISNIKSISVEFIQTDSNNIIANGMLIIDKPYKFRCNYYAPFPIVIIGNKNYVSVYDYEMEYLSRIKSSENIFNFLLTDNIKFENEFEILYSEEKGNYYIFKIREYDTDKIAEICFDKESKHIKSMKIFEDNNIITLDFYLTRKIHNVNSRIFDIKDPDIFGAPKRFKKEDLEKILNFKD